MKVRSNCFPKKFLLIYLVDDEEQRVEAYESNEIDFEEVVKRLEQGESVFIRQRPGKDVNLPQASHDIVTKNLGKRREPWYFAHI